MLNHYGPLDFPSLLSHVNPSNKRQEMQRQVARAAFAAIPSTEILNSSLLCSISVAECLYLTQDAWKLHLNRE